jgi:hypothetical protein
MSEDYKHLVEHNWVLRGSLRICDPEYKLEQLLDRWSQMVDIDGLFDSTDEWMIFMDRITCPRCLVIYNIAREELHGCSR